MLLIGVFSVEHISFNSNCFLIERPFGFHEEFFRFQRPVSRFLSLNHEEFFRFPRYQSSIPKSAHENHIFSEIIARVSSDRIPKHSDFCFRVFVLVESLWSEEQYDFYLEMENRTHSSRFLRNRRCLEDRQSTGSTVSLKER